MVFVIGSNMYTHRDTIGSRTIDPEKSLPYIIANYHFILILITLKSLSIWYLQIFVVLSYYLCFYALVNEFHHQKYLVNTGIISTGLIITIILIKYNEDNIAKYLQNFQEQLQESISVKWILDNLSEGIILISKDFKIAYQNNPVLSLFGYEEQDEDSIELVAQTISIFKFQLGKE